jgi:hypothetical protein
MIRPLVATSALLVTHLVRLPVCGEASTRAYGYPFRALVEDCSATIRKYFEFLVIVQSDD